MDVLFARIGYMKFYQGPQKGDEKPIDGGKYNKDKIGHEAYNFKALNGKLYGYFQPHMKSPYKINLSRINPVFSKNSAQDVLVIFFSKNPIGKGQVIVGWYKGSTVYEYIQSPKNQKARDNFGYNIVADEKDAVLLPVAKRKFFMGHGIIGVKEGNPGQANAFYLRDEKNKIKTKDKHNSWIFKAIEYVNNYEGPSIRTFEDEVSEELENSAFGSSGQGFQSNIELKKLVEEYSMNKCKKHFLSNGYEIEDVSLTKPYDFVAKKDGKEYFIEVKGTQTDGSKIILTKNEVEMSKKKSTKMILYLVHSIEMNRKTIKIGSGQAVIIDPWEIDESKLTVVSYTYNMS
ncbi:DUF3883 domain-containing protein [Methylomonas koyamae]|uniref:DUF3883 domain-containing protein n=1 Tax=Methylomonas koyamae TaxID=702114 RepID=UPI000AD9A335|nr:DUF3883 domain-containing protein [Methylomonas koyamae]BBL58832.1 hypothetical protein MKFW12EY_24450 [Methylomonas koyamae]